MKKISCLSLLMASAAAVSAQGVTDVMQYSQTDIVGTARYMGMAGAFNALGGDISTLSQNPAGIGIYRSSEVVATLDIGGVEATTSLGANKLNTTGTNLTDSKFNIGANNLGYVGTFFTGNRDGLVSFNVGFAYNRQAFQKRRYRVTQNNMASGVSDYAADITNQWGGSASDLYAGEINKYDPFYDSSAPWLSILGYNAYVVNPSGNSYEGIYAADGYSVGGDLFVNESKRIDEYTFNVGGNVSNLVYWGLGIGVSDITQSQNITYDEYYWPSGQAANALNYQNFQLNNYLKTTGTGVNAKFGIIVRPANQFRFGAAVHTPTWYRMTDTYGADMQSWNVPDINNGNASCSSPIDSYDYKLRTPWKFQFGAAYIFGRQGLISVDYEHVDYSYNHLSDVDSYYNNSYSSTNEDMKNQLQGVNTLRVGTEWRLSPEVSLRLGYANQSSPYTDAVRENRSEIYAAGTVPNYLITRGTQYYTGGLGFRSGSFFADFAFVWKANRAYSYLMPTVSDRTTTYVQSVGSNVKTTSYKFLATVGYKF